MADLTLDEVSSNYFDVLRELGNIGAGNAMTALSQMLNCKVDMSVPKVELLSFPDLGEAIGGEEQVMVGVFLGVEGDVTGSMLFLVEEKSAKHMIKKVMMGMPVPDEGFSDMEISAMQEIGNIITGAYLNSLATMTNLTIVPSPPALTVDMASAILSVPAIEFGIYGDQILMIESKFFDEVELDGYFVLVPDIDSYKKILNSLGLAL